MESIDGAGTSTQAAKLAAWIKDQGKPVHLTSEPSAGASIVIPSEKLQADLPAEIKPAPAPET